MEINYDTTLNIRNMFLEVQDKIIKFKSKLNNQVGFNVANKNANVYISAHSKEWIINFLDHGIILNIEMDKEFVQMLNPHSFKYSDGRIAVKPKYDFVVPAECFLSIADVVVFKCGIEADVAFVLNEILQILEKDSIAGTVSYGDNDDVEKYRVKRKH